MMLKMGGADASMTFKERNPEALCLAQSMRNLDIGDLHAAINLIVNERRWFASVSTQYIRFMHDSAPVWLLIRRKWDIVSSGAFVPCSKILAGRCPDSYQSPRFHSPNSTVRTSVSVSSFNQLPASEITREKKQPRDSAPHSHAGRLDTSEKAPAYVRHRARFRQWMCGAIG